MGFTRDLWKQAKTMQASKASLIFKLIDNIRFLYSNLSLADVTEERTQTNAKRVNYTGESYQVTVIMHIPKNNGVSVVIDDKIDWRRRFVTIRGFIRYTADNQQGSYLPGGVNECLLGRYSPTSIVVVPTLPFGHGLIIKGKAQSRVHQSFFTSSGIDSDPTDTDPFGYDNYEVSFCRLGCEDSKDTDLLVPEFEGSFVFLFVSKSDGKLKCRLGKVLIWNEITVPPPVDDMVIALNLFASQQV